MTRVKLKDGRIVEMDIDPTWGPDAVQRAIKEYKGKEDRGDDSWGEWTDKQVKSAARGGGAGLASTGDFILNTGDAMINAGKWAIGDRNYRPITDAPLRTSYEGGVIPQPPGYEDTAHVAEVVAPAAVETLLTGSPKTAPLRFIRDAGLGYAGGEAGEEIGGAIGGEEGATLGRLMGSLVSPAAATRTGARGAAAAVSHMMGGHPLLTAMPFAAKLGGFAHLDPFKLIPPTKVKSLAVRVPAATSAGTGGSFTQDQAEDEAKQREIERYRKMTTGQ